MNTSQIFFITFLVLATSFITTLTIYLDHHDQDIHSHNFVNINVHITNALPENDPEPMKMRCKSKNTDLGVQTLRSGDDYKIIVEETSEYFCEALWERFMTSWHAFEPKRDIAQPSVFWLVKQDGFFLSWDNSTFVKNSTWETE